jgi:hypothetical protein
VATKKADKKTVKQQKADWRSAFIAKYPQYAKIVDGGDGEAEARSVFGNELIDLVLDAAENPDKYMLDTDAGTRAFDAKVFATPYYNQTADSAKAFDALTDGERADKILKNRQTIMSKYGDLNLTSAELDTISESATKRGLTGASLDYYINTVAGSRPRGKQDLLNSADAAAYKKVAKAYGYNPPDLDEEIFAAIQGKQFNGSVPTLDSIKAKGLQLAKAAHFQLAPQLDAGLTLDEIFTPYKDIASRTLELAPESIDFMDPKFRAAFGSMSERPPTLGEWQDMIKSDTKYGYENTKQAKSDAVRLVNTMARVFGEVI